MQAATTQRNFWRNVADGVAIQSSLSLASPVAILPLFVAQHTQSLAWVSLVPATFILGALPQLWMGRQALQAPDFRRAMLWQSLLPRLALVALAATPFLPAAWVLPAFFLVLAFFSCTLSGGAAAWLSFIGEVIPASQQGRFFGQRKAWGGVAAVLATVGAGGLLQAFPGALGFGLCFGLAALVALAAMLGLVRTEHDWSGLVRPQPLPMRALAKGLWAEASFRRYLLARLAISGAGMAGAFYVLDAASRFGLGTAAASLLALAFTMMPKLAGAFWGHLTDRMGHQPVLLGASLVAGLAHLALPFASALPLVVACLVAIGCAQAVCEISDSREILALGAGRCAEALGLFNLALMPSALLALLAAAWVAEALGMPVVFSLAGLAWLGGALALAWPATAAPLPNEAIARTKPMARPFATRALPWARRSVRPVA